MLNKIKSLLKKTDLHSFEYTVKELVGMYENTPQSIKWHGKKLDNEILEYKKSDTVFLLGSGPSINDITDSDWAHITEKDSIGFNFWFAHDFVPDIYVFQLSDKIELKESTLNILKDKYIQYKDIPFIIRGSEFSKGNIDFKDERINLLKNNPVYYLNEYPYGSSCSIEPELLYRYMDALGFMSHGEISKFIPKWRGTLGLLIMLAYQMGYKKIVLCGMDMQDSDHFWDYEPNLYIKEKYSLPGKGVSNISTFNDEKRSKNTVERYVYTLNEWFKKHNNVKIYVMNKKTVLYPEISLYNY